VTDRPCALPVESGHCSGESDWGRPAASDRPPRLPCRGQPRNPTPMLPKMDTARTVVAGAPIGSPLAPPSPRDRPIASRRSRRRSPRCVRSRKAAWHNAAVALVRT
jgi:hypothetical protein